MAVFGVVDVFGLRPEDGDALRMELERKVIRYLTACGEDDTTWGLQLEDV